LPFFVFFWLVFIQLFGLLLLITAKIHYNK
jgi:hypothetical protein